MSAVAPFFDREEVEEVIPAPAAGLAAVTKTYATFRSQNPPAEIHTTSWTPDKSFASPSALVFLCHGYGEYMSASYERVARYFSSRGVLVFGHDHLGHGRTSGERVQTVVSFEVDYAGPVIEHCKEKRKAHPGLPLIIVGHSLGGLVSILAILKEPSIFDFSVLMGPLVVPSPDMASSVNVFLAKWMSYVCPSLHAQCLGGVKTEHITRSVEWQQRIQDDKLFWHGGIKVWQGYSCLKAMDVLNERMGEIQLPIYIQHGADDKICLPNGSQKLFDSVASKDKTLKFYPGAYHDMFIGKGGNVFRVFSVG